jgi:RNA polymerase sigma factor (sigma-70 family)
MSCAVPSVPRTFRFKPARRRGISFERPNQLTRRITLETELQRAIEEAITELPESQRMALILRRYEQLTYDQIADIPDLSVPAVKAALFRARTELRARLSKYLA